MKRQWKMYFLVSIGLGAFLLGRIANAQEIPLLSNWPNPGLKAQHQNWSMAQGDDARMYFANSNGLLTFDGQQWETFSLPKNQIVRALGIDAEGRIFVAGYGECGYWQANAKGELVYHSLSETLPYDRISSEEIWKLQIGDGWVLFQSFATLFLYDYDSLKIVAPPGGGTISLIQEVGDRYLLFQRSEKLVELFVSPEEVIFKDVLEDDLLRNKGIASVLPMKDDGLLISTTKSDLFYFDGEQLNPWGKELTRVLKPFQINRCIQLSSGNYAFGTILNGVYIADSNGDILFHVNQESGLQNNTVLSLYEDVRGHLWIGLDNGIDMINLNTPLRIFNDMDGKLGAIYSAKFYEDELYVGSNHGLFRKEKNRTDRFKLIPGSQGQVWELRNLGDMLLVGHNDGTFGWDGKSFKRISSQSGGWCSEFIPDSSGRLIQGTYGGLLVYKEKKGQWEEHHRMNDFPTSVKQLYIDQKQHIWAINPYSGVQKLTFDAEWTQLTRKTAVAELPIDFNLRLMGGKAHHILKSGEKFYDLAEGELTSIRRIGSIPLTPDVQQVWIGAAQDTFISYSDRIELKRGCLTQSFPLRLIPNYEKIEDLGNGVYLFCLESGYALFHSNSKEVSPSQIPALEVREIVSLEEDPILILGNHASKMEAVVRLNAYQKNLRFACFLPYYEGRARFRFRLTGFDSHWSDWSERTFKEYTNLGPGSYRLEVQESQFGQTTSIEFYLPPPWYRSSLAFFVYFLLFLALGVAVYYIHRLVVKRQERRTAIEKEREFQRKIIQEKNEQLQKDIQNKSRELANSTMGLIRKNETLMELKQELDDLYTLAGKAMPKGPYQRLLRRIDRSLSDEKDWQVFEMNFNQVHEEFFQKLKQHYPDLTAGDLRLAAFLRMGLSSKEIAPLFNISLRGIENKRYRLRKKMNLEGSQNLLDILMGL
ncbi:MAG: triple tyrosine motif-containing protein [Bacteroidota bacterium]